jgi:hypothetical protein
MRSVAEHSSSLKAAVAAVGDIDAVKAVCAALALAIVTLGFRILALW